MKKSFFYFFNFLICLFFYKLLGVLGFNTFILVYKLSLPIRLLISLFLFLILVFYSNVLIPLLLNNFIFQLLFFLFLGVENLLLGLPFWIALLLIFIFWLDLSYYSYSYSPLVWEYSILSALLVITSYNQLRKLLVNPEIEGSDLELETENDLTWERIVHNISILSLKFYGKSVQNRIKANDTFPYIAKRYMTFGRLRILGEAASSSAGNFFRSFWEACKSHPSGVLAATGAAGTTGTGVAMAIKEYGPAALADVELKKTENELKKTENELKKEEVRKLRIDNDQRERQASLESDKREEVRLQTDLAKLQEEIERKKKELGLFQEQTQIIKSDKDSGTTLSCVLEESFFSFFNNVF